MNKTKKILIIAGGIFLLMLAVVSALNILNTGNLTRDVGFNAPSGTGLPSGSLDISRNTGNFSESAMESANQKAVAPLPSRDAASLSESTSGNEPIEISKKIIRNGDLIIKVNSADGAAQKISVIATDFGGSILSSNIWEASNRAKSGTITIKVPVDRFDETVAELKKVAALVVSESTAATDVTEQYVDLEARLKNKKAEEQAFADILNRSGQIDDVLKVTRELARVRGEIEQLEGQKKVLDSRADMSTITVSLSEDERITITDSWRPFQVAKDAVNALVQRVQKFVNFLIILVVTVVPVFVLYALLFWAIFLIARKIYRKLKKNKPAENGPVEVTQEKK